MQINAKQFMAIEDNEDGTSTIRAELVDPSGNPLEVSFLIQSSLWDLMMGLVTPSVLEEGLRKMDEIGTIELPSRLPES